MQEKSDGEISATDMDDGLTVDDFEISEKVGQFIACGVDCLVSVFQPLKRLIGRSRQPEPR